MTAATTTQLMLGRGAQRWLGSFGLLLSTIAFSLIVGPLGLLLGVAVVAAWYWFSSVIGFALGHMVLLLFPQALSSPYLFAVEIGLACLLISSTIGENEPRQAGLGIVIAFVILGAFVWFGQNLFDALWPIALLLITIVILVAYGFHRYERLRLGFMEENQT